MKVKICGLTRAEDARAAASLGADFLGAVLVPGTPRAVDPAQARKIGRAGGRPLVVVVADPTVDEAVAAAEEAEAYGIQFHGNEPPDLLRDVASRGPWRVWKAFRIRNPGELPEQVGRYATGVHAIVLDGWDAGARGGTGRTFSWEAVAAERPRLPRELEVVVAGGLTPENVGRAIELLGPSAVDVSSGVESAPGVKDPRRLERFMVAARTAATAAFY